MDDKGPEQPPPDNGATSALLDEVVRLILSMPGCDVRKEGDRKRLRVQLAAMFSRDKEYLVDLAIERALQLASQGASRERGRDRGRGGGMERRPNR